MNISKTAQWINEVWCIVPVGFLKFWQFHMTEIFSDSSLIILRWKKIDDAVSESNALKTNSESCVSGHSDVSL